MDSADRFCRLGVDSFGLLGRFPGATTGRARLLQNDEQQSVSEEVLESVVGELLDMIGLLAVLFALCLACAVHELLDAL